jgi:hypothetical protein
VILLPQPPKCWNYKIQYHTQLNAMCFCCLWWKHPTLGTNFYSNKI